MSAECSPMHEPHRQWPAPAPEPTKRTPTPPEGWLALILIPVAPLATWLVAALPGQRDWAGVIWPAGWIGAVLLVLGGAYARQRRSK
jgi:hypothetical protein